MNNDVYINFNGPFDIVETGVNENIRLNIKNLNIPKEIVDDCFDNKFPEEGILKEKKDLQLV